MKSFRIINALILVAISSILILGTLIKSSRAGSHSTTTAKETKATNSLKWAGPVSGPEQIVYQIRRGDTLGKILSPYKLPRQETQLWFRSIAKNYSLKKLRPGRKVYLYLSQRNYHSARDINNWHLKALAIELNKDQILTWERGNKGVVFQKRKLPYEKEIKTASVRITNSLYQDGLRGGLSPALISRFVDIFAWEINFQTDLRNGDFLKVLYERRFRTGTPKKEKFRILAAEFTNNKRKYHALFFKQRNGSGNYYDLEGVSLARSFLRYPVRFSRISSTFSHRRYHPILKVRRPHRGVDFVTKRGTPIRAVGDGRITYAGWKNGGYGRFIEIQHGSVFKTRYAHLHRIVRGLRRGKIVKKGQVIGTVGCSGRCTGPHLHFEMYKQGRYVNPLKFVMPREEKINPDLQKLFDKTKQLFLAQLFGIPRS